MRFLSLICFVALLFATSCTTQKKTINNYLETAHDTTGREVYLKSQPPIQKGDLLSIKVYSEANGIKPEVDAPYNLAEGTSSAGAQGYLVDQEGNIEYPQLGVIHVQGLTREQAAALIKQKVQDSNQLTNPTVSVRFLNYKITILGEVHTPGTFTFPTENVNILQALGLAGDITEFGKKTTVKVVRENSGQVDIGTIDLTSADLFTSPYYHLQQNDIVMVEQTQRKVKQQEEQAVATQIGIASSIITAIALIITIIKN